jgi:hypothetical protein
MEYSEITVLFYAFVAFIFFVFTFWREATKEGFGSDKILDASILMLVAGVISGKLLFHELSINYFKYQFLNSPIILESALIGGGLSLYFYIKKNNWSGTKIGDIIAPAMAVFQAMLFLGFWLVNKNWSSLLVFGLFSLLFILIRLLLNKKEKERQIKALAGKGIHKIFFTGGLLSIYLTGSSLIAILSLVLNRNIDSRFWWFQVVFYLSVLSTSLIFFSKRYVANNKVKNEFKR